MALNDANGLHIVSIPLCSLATDNTQVPAIYLSRKSRLKAARIINGAALAASDTDYVQVGVQLVGSTVLAELDSRAAHENGLAKNVAKSLNLVGAGASTGSVEIAAGSSLEFDYQEAGTVALTNAVLQLEFTQE